MNGFILHTGIHGLVLTVKFYFSGSATEGPCEVLGRQCLKFRSCACPKRDKDNNERRMAQDMGEGSLSSSSVLSSKRRREGGEQHLQK